MSLKYTPDDFNTSHVSINHHPGIPQTAQGRISIHLMFLLINDALRKMPFTFDHFNTSHVSINLNQDLSLHSQIRYFNTSHVSINRRPLL